MRANPSSFKRRFALSFSSWFCIPEQGMKDFEILCRASAFLLPVSAADRSIANGENSIFSPVGKSKYHLLTVSHAAAPWRWPKLYPAEWLQHVNENHIHYTVEIRHDDGIFMTQSDLKPQAFIHSKRDLAVLHLDEEDETIKMLKSMDLLDTQLLLSDSDQIDNYQNKELSFYGHAVTSSSMYATDSDERLVVPTTATGTILGRTEHQIFSKTSPVLVDGMCGGPVCDKVAGADNFDGSISKKIVRGMVEGIVPHTFHAEEIRGAAVFVESGEIRSFLNDIEAGRVQPIVGGEAQRIVGSDQDPDKMDLEKLIRGASSQNNANNQNDNKPNRPHPTRAKH